jgi:hypothetical protein
VAPQDQPLIADDELEIADQPGQPALDMLFHFGQFFACHGVKLKTHGHADLSQIGQAPVGS